MLNSRLEALRLKDSVRNADDKISAHANHAGKAGARRCLASADQGRFNRQQRTASLHHRNAALTAAATPTTGGRQQHPVAGERPQQPLAAAYFELLVFINGNSRHAAGHQQSAGGEHDRRQDQHEACCHGHGNQDFRHGYTSIPESPAKPKASRPVTMKPSPSPFSPSGGSL